MRPTKGPAQQPTAQAKAAHLPVGKNNMGSNCRTAQGGWNRQARTHRQEPGTLNAAPVCAGTPPRSASRDWKQGSAGCCGRLVNLLRKVLAELPEQRRNWGTGLAQDCFGKTCARTGDWHERDFRRRKPWRCPPDEAPPLRGPATQRAKRTKRALEKTSVGQTTRLSYTPPNSQRCGLSSCGGSTHRLVGGGRSHARPGSGSRACDCYGAWLRTPPASSWQRLDSDVRGGAMKREEWVG